MTTNDLAQRIIDVVRERDRKISSFLMYTKEHEKENIRLVAEMIDKEMEQAYEAGQGSVVADPFPPALSTGVIETQTYEEWRNQK